MLKTNLSQNSQMTTNRKIIGVIYKRHHSLPGFAQSQQSLLF